MVQQLAKEKDKKLVKKTRTVPVRTQNQIWNLRQRLDLSLRRIFPIYQEWIKPFLLGAAIDVSDLKTKSPTYQTKGNIHKC